MEYMEYNRQQLSIMCSVGYKLQMELIRSHALILFYTGSTSLIFMLHVHAMRPSSVFPIRVYLM